MKKLFLSLAAVATFAGIAPVAAAAPFRTAASVDDLLIDGKRFDVSGRYLSGKLDDRIIEIHRVTITDIDGKEIKVRVRVAEEAQHRALRRHSECALSPSTCRPQPLK